MGAQAVKTFLKLVIASSGTDVLVAVDSIAAVIPKAVKDGPQQCWISFHGKGGEEDFIVAHSFEQLWQALQSVGCTIAIPPHVIPA